MSGLIKNAKEVREALNGRSAKKARSKVIKCRRCDVEFQLRESLKIHNNKTHH